MFSLKTGKTHGCYLTFEYLTDFLSLVMYTPRNLSYVLREALFRLSSVALSMVTVTTKKKLGGRVIYSQNTQTSRLFYGKKINLSVCMLV